MRTWARALGTLALALTVAGVGCSDGGSDSDDDDDDIDLSSMGGTDTYQGSGGGDSTSSGGSTSSSSGGATNEEGCPEEMPGMGGPGQNECSDVGLECTYETFGGTWVCECTDFGWRCELQDTGEGGATSTDGCPDNEPATGDPCDFDLIMTSCDYGGTTCTCTFQGGPGGGNQPTWNCDGFQFGTGGTDGSGGADQGSGGTESTECADGNACSTPGSSCTSADGDRCFCNTNNEWECNS